MRTVVSRTWTTSDQVQFLRSYEEQYMKAAQSKKISAFFASFFPKWFEKYPEDDASGDATDVDGDSLSKSAKASHEKEKKAADARRIIIEARADLTVRTAIDPTRI